MESRTKDAIHAHAAERPHEEVCGLIVSLEDREAVVQARNVSETPGTNFILDPRDYASAAKFGKIVAIYHSHTSQEPAVPSPADIAACNRLSVPYVIYYGVTDSFDTVQPSPEPTPLLGRKFLWHVHDCYTLIQDYFARTLRIELPNFLYEPFFWRKGKNPYMEGFAQAGFVKVDAPREHDVLLMQIHAPVPNHGAVLTGDGKILHHVLGRLSCRDVYGDYWRKVTVQALRHKELR